MENVLIKSSGDTTENQSFIEFVLEKSRHSNVVVICGGGTKISEKLKEAGYDIEFDELGRRITKTWMERTIMQNVLEEERQNLQNKFNNAKIAVVSPILYAGNVMCPINGDDLVKAYELGFDEIYVFTISNRIEKKSKIFANSPKIKIVGV